jgi:hypothetical protein
MARQAAERSEGGKAQKIGSPSAVPHPLFDVYQQFGGSSCRHSADGAAASCE